MSYAGQRRCGGARFLTGVKLVITEGLPAWDQSDDENIRKKNLLTYAFLIAPAVAPIVYLWGVL